MFRLQKVFKNCIRYSSDSSGSFNRWLNGRKLSDMIKEAEKKMHEPKVVEEQLKHLLGPIAHTKKMLLLQAAREEQEPGPLCISEFVQPWLKAEIKNHAYFWKFWFDLCNFIERVDRRMDESFESTSTEFIFGDEIFKDAIELCPNSEKMVNDFFMKYRFGHSVKKIWKQTSTVPTIEEYLEIASIKYSSMQLTVSMEQEKAGDTQDFSHLLRIFSRFLTVCDDYSDFIRDEYETHKKLCQSMTNGTLTLPAVHAYKIMNNTEVLDILKMRSNDDGVKKRFVSILEEMGSFEYTINYLDELDAALNREILKFGKNEKMHEWIDKKLTKMLLNSKIVV